LIQFSNVSKTYDKKITAVDDINFKIEPGEFVFLIGPSGSGKTTVIKMIIRDEEPSSGRIFFDDRDVTRVNRRSVYKLRREIGVIFQDYKLIEDKTAYENVAFAMEAAGKKDKDIKETVPYVLDIVGLSNRMKSFPRQLSGGEQQRVAIARAISNSPKILIADEPTGNLDPASAWDIVQILSKINNWGTTVIMSTHGTDIVNSLNKRVIQMHSGKILRDDNKGQYEMSSSYEKKVVEESEKEEEKKEKEKETQSKNKFKTTIKLEVEENKVDKVQRGGIFSLFRRKKNDKVEDNSTKPLKDTTIQEKLSNSNEYNNEEKKKTITKPETLHISLEKAVVADEDITIPKISEEKLKKLLKKKKKTRIDTLDLTNKVKVKLEKTGYNYIEEIVQNGVDGLSKNPAFDPDEIIQISKEIKAFIEENSK